MNNEVLPQALEAVVEAASKWDVASWGLGPEEGLKERFQEASRVLIDACATVYALSLIDNRPPTEEEEAWAAEVAARGGAAADSATMEEDS